MLGMLSTEKKKSKDGDEKIALIESFNPEWRILNEEIRE